MNRTSCVRTSWPDVEIDDNLIEIAVRPLVVGKKAFLFVGSHQTADMAAGMNKIFHYGQLQKEKDQ